MSHPESFDPKPMLNRFAGRSIAETPYRGALDPALLTRGPPTTITALRRNSTPAGICSTAITPPSAPGVNDGLASLNDNLPQYISMAVQPY